MEWGNAKRFVVILLVILNVALAGLNYRQRQENTMTSAQERAIFEVLSQNGITMYTDLLTDSLAMSRLAVKLPEYSKETLERLFFGSEKTTVTAKGSQNVYRNEYAVLTLDGARGVFKKASVESGKGKLTSEDARQIAEEFMIGTEHFFGTYEEPEVRETEEGFLVTFYGTYKRENVYSNYFSFLVTKGGIKEIEFNYCPIQGYSGEKRDLCYSDEALLAFMREWKKNGKEGESTIYRMEIGYDKMERSDGSTDGAIYLDPCYRIYLMDEAEPYLINGYTCQIMYKDEK